MTQLRTSTLLLTGMVIAVATYGLSCLITDALTNYGGSAALSQTVAAWVQAIGSIMAILGAYHLSFLQSRNAIKAAERAHELATRAKIEGHLAVIDAAMIHVRQFMGALDAQDPRLALSRVYDKVVVQAARAALNSIPPYELGRPTAVVPLLSMGNQFGFLETAMETYLAGPFRHPELSKTLETLQHPDDRKQFDEVLEVARSVLIENVKVHLKRIEADYCDLSEALGRTLPEVHLSASRI